MAKVKAALTNATYVLGQADPAASYVLPDGTAYVQIYLKTDAASYDGPLFQFDVNTSPATIRNQAKAAVVQYLLDYDGTVVTAGNVKISGIFE